MQPLRIVIDVRHIKDFGIGTYIRNLVKALAEVDRENRYMLATNDPQIPDFGQLPDNFETVLHHEPKRPQWDNIAFPWFLKGLAPDLVHLPRNDVPIFMQHRYVVTIHDMSSFLFGGRTGTREDIRLYRFRRGLLRAQRVIAVSSATRRDVEHLLGVRPERVRLVYSAPDPNFLNRPTDPDMGRRLLERFSIQHPYILYAGRIRPHKNIPRLVEAFAVVRSELENHPVYKDLRLLIIGDEISRNPEVRRAVAQTHTEQVVRFLGFVPFDTLRQFYASASVFAFPSLYEGFGLPPLEAMATGIPVVTSAVSSLPEVVGDAAMIVNPENVFDIARGLREVLVDEALRTRLITAGHRQVRQFNWRRTAEQTLEVYREVAKRH
ncbi:MAG TPA: glycosyltransferase family 1 protein [Bryobacteraceae bacterium]|nr:glycosyltransferase family 1 protein [Bryobacteraceae bacterium]